MKKIIFLLLISTSLFGQEMTRNPYQKWMTLYVEVPNGCDIKKDKGILEYQKVSDKTIDKFIKENKLKDFRFGKYKVIDDSEYWTSRGFCERVVYKNFSSIVRMEYTVWKREPKIDYTKPDEDKYKKIKKLFKEGRVKREVDSLVYRKFKKVQIYKDTLIDRKLDTIPNIVKVGTIN